MTDESGDEREAGVDADRVTAPPGTRERIADVGALVRIVARESSDTEVTFIAAAVAYYAFVSLVPLALLGVAVASVVGGGQLATGVSAAFGRLLTQEGKAVIESAVLADAGRDGATVLGVAVLLWGGLKLFRGLDRAFSLVYGSNTGSLPEQFVDAVTVLGAILVGVGALVLLGSLVGILGLPPVAQVAGLGAVWLTLVVAFLPLYYVFPDVEVSPREALPGAVLAATAFAALGALFGLYAARAGSYALYGLLGAVLLLLTWLYVAAAAVMVGAVLNAVVAGRLGGWREQGDAGGAVDGADGPKVE